MCKVLVVVVTVVFGLTMFDISSAHAQRVSGSDMTTGEGGPIQADQCGPPRSRHWSPTAVAKFGSGDHHTGRRSSCVAT
jgi:hypothetical protein